MIRFEYQPGASHFLKKTPGPLEPGSAEKNTHVCCDFGELSWHNIELPQDLKALLAYCRFNDDCLIERLRTGDFFFILALCLRTHVNDKGNRLKGEIAFQNSVHLHCSVYPQSFTLEASQDVKALEVYISKENFVRFLSLDVKRRDRTFAVFHALLSKGMTKQEFTTHHLQFFQQEDFRPVLSGMLPEDHLNGQILSILEQFFLNLSLGLNDELPLVCINDDEMARISEIAAILTSDPAKIPPSIAELSRKAVMSTTRLKYLFKKIYNTSVYNYFMSHRMQKAKEMLETGQYSVKQVGTQLGYTNLSHFTAAYKKVLGNLPGEVRRQITRR